MSAFYLDYIGLAKTLRGIKHNLDLKVNNADVSINNGVVTINGVSITPATNVEWDGTNHILKLTKGGTATNIVVGGVSNGIAFLDANGKVDPSQLPAFVDDIVDGYLNVAYIDVPANYHTSITGSHTYTIGDIVCDDVSTPTKYYFVNTGFTSDHLLVENCVELKIFPTPGIKGKIYYDVSTGKSYRWSGTAYVEIIAHAGSTDDIPEGSTNLYFTDARALAALATALAGKADLNGQVTVDFNANNLKAKTDIIAGVNSSYPNGKAKLTENGDVIGLKGYLNELGANDAYPESQSNTKMSIKVNSVLKSLIANGKQPNVAYIIEDNDVTNPGLLDPIDTSAIYDAFAAAGIMLGANKTEGMAILDGTTNSDANE